LKYSFYKDLQHMFLEIRFMHMGGEIDKSRLETTVSNIKASRKKINANSRGQEKEILLYCIDTLFSILGEGNVQKIFDFADAIHNIPEIYMQERNLYSLRAELKAFRKKYGKEYFPFIDRVKPAFSKKAPKNSWEFFFPESDEDFKRLHPVGYWVLVIIGLAVLMLPYILFSVYTTIINPVAELDAPMGAKETIAMILGFVGTFTFGVGLFNIVAAWIHQYLGHLLTLISFVAGSIITMVALMLIYA